MNIRSLLGRWGPLLAITAAFTWACVTIAMRRGDETPPDTTVIRIGHWQLEAGVRQAFDELGLQFAQLPQVKAKYGKVLIVQDAIPEGTYGQWITSNMIAHTAPDLVEIGMGLAPNIWLAYQNRYFEPLTTLANEPNPFNKGTDLEGIPLRLTFDDAMRSGYLEELQEYMRMPLSRFTARIFYNRTLLRKLTGRNEPPTHFREFINLCQTISTLKDPTGQKYSPIASSKYHSGMWDGGVCLPLTFELLYQTDFNRDGTLGNDEMFATIKSGRLNFQNRAIQARYRMFAELIQYFQKGFAGLNRDEAVFRFAQQQAVFITTGTWDVMSLVEQAKDQFEVGIMAFPQPAADDPDYGPFVLGPAYDPAGQAFPFGLTRSSRHPELAKDFLLFLASKQGNQRLNEIIDWIPAVRSVPLPAMLAKFAPVNQGQYACFNTDLGGETYIQSQQMVSRLLTDPKYQVADFLADFEPYYKDHGLRDWHEQQRDWRRAIINNDKFLAGLRGEALVEVPDRLDDPLWIKYRAYTASRQVMLGIWRAEQVQMVEKGPQRPVGPYEYLPQALENARRVLRAASPPKPSIPSPGP